MYIVPLEVAAMIDGDLQFVDLSAMIGLYIDVAASRLVQDGVKWDSIIVIQNPSWLGRLVGGTIITEDRKFHHDASENMRDFAFLMFKSEPELQSAHELLRDWATSLGLDYETRLLIFIKKQLVRTTIIPAAKK